jgi:hypothetical protein
VYLSCVSGLVYSIVRLVSEILKYNNINNNSLVDWHYTHANTKFSALHIPCINLKLYIVNEIFILNSTLFATHFY